MKYQYTTKPLVSGLIDYLAPHNMSVFFLVRKELKAIAFHHVKSPCEHSKQFGKDVLADWIST